MKLRHVLLGIVVAGLWGLNFVAARVALDHVTPLLLLALRFAIAACPALIVPRPAVGWTRLFALASTLFVGQFAFLFWGLKLGMPAGLAAVVTQAQAVLTALLAVPILRERPRRQTWVGLVVASVGLTVIGTTVGAADIPIAGFGLTLAAALSWATGNILLRGAGNADRFALVVWLSVIPPAPALLLCLFVDGPQAFHGLVDGPVWITASAVLYTGLAATLFGYGLWAHLLRIYPPAVVAPFALLVPVFGLAAAKMGLSEQLSSSQLAGAVLILAGLLLTTIPIGRPGRRFRRLRAG